MKLEKARRVQCKQCKHTWMSKVDVPRCSKCGSREIETLKITKIPTPSIELLKSEKLNERIEELEERVTTLRNWMTNLATTVGNLNERVMEGDFELIYAPKEMWMKTKCKYYNNGFCTKLIFPSRPSQKCYLRTVKTEIGWLADPDPRYCALCPCNTLSRE